MTKLLYEELTYKIIGASKEVYRVLGPGFFESVYEDALCYELDLLNIPYQRQVELDVYYKEPNLNEDLEPVFLWKIRFL